MQRKSTSKRITSIMFVVMLFYATFIAMIETVISSTWAGIAFVLLILLGSVLLLLVRFRSLHLLINPYWLAIFLVIALSSRWLITEGNTYWLGIYLALTVTIIFAGTNTSWVQSAIQICGAFALVHVFATIVLWILPTSFYMATIGHLYDSVPGGLSTYAEAYKAGICRHYSANGTYCAVALVIYASKVIGGQGYMAEKYNRYHIFSLLSLLAVILTTKRAHLLFSLCSVILTYYVCANRRRGTKVFNILSFCILGLTLFYLASFFVPAISNVFSRFTVDSDADISTGRFLYWQQAWNLFQESKWQGIGWLRYSEYNPYGTSVHNVYIQLLCETGIIGFSVFAIGMISTFFGTIRAYRRLHIWMDVGKRQAFSVSIAIQAFVLMYCLTGNCFYDMTVFFYYFAVVVSCAVRHDNKENHTLGVQI